MAEAVMNPDSAVSLAKANGIAGQAMKSLGLIVACGIGSQIGIGKTTAQAQSATSCQVTNSSCPNNPPYSGTFSDNYNFSASNQAVCMSRASAFYSWCGIPAGGKSTASFISGGNVVQTVTAGTPTATPTPSANNSCQVTNSSCPNNPSYSGTFSDNYNGSASNQAVCMSRASAFYSWCGISAGGNSTASYLSGGNVVQTVTAGATTPTPTPSASTSCQVTNSSCPNHPSYSGTFSDNYNFSATNQAVCISRASAFYSWCGIPASGNSAASFISDGKVVQTVTAGTSAPPPTTTPPPAPPTPVSTPNPPNGCFNFGVPLPQLQLSANALGDEFVGPFASWADLKRDFHAAGNGVTDDTQALQAALNALSKAGNSPILYIPAGTYLITSTVTITAANGISIIGADPATTTLKWGGGTAGILLHIDGVAYSRFDRITFDGNGTAGVLVDQSLTGYAQGQYFDTGNEYADDVFKNAGTGIQAGQYGLGAAESSVLRSDFLNNNVAGIILKNFNALDWWVWYSYFQDNRVGITNNPGAGNFHAFNNTFTGSIYSDLDILNTGTFNFRDNFSINSNVFLIEEYYFTNAAVTRLQSNTVIVPPGNACQGCAVEQLNMGPTVMTDNTFVSPPNAAWPTTIFHSFTPPDCVSVGDTLVNNNSIVCESYPDLVAGRKITQDDQVVSPSSINQTPPKLPGVLINYHRKVFEVPPGSNSAPIQTAIQQASAFCGQRPIVHLPYGSYSLNQTVTIPANCDIQLVGDGLQTALKWAGTGNGPVLLLQGPSRAMLRDFYLNAGSVTGIDIQNADQQGSRIYMQQPQVGRSTLANILVDGLDYTNVELHNFNLGNTAVAPATTGVALQVVGGPLAKQGNPQYGRTNLLAGSLSSNYLSFQVSQGASVLVRDAWYEGTGPSTYAQISDNSSFTVEGSRIAVPVGGGDAIRINNSSCNVAVVASAPDAGVSLSNGNGNVWALGNNFGAAKSFLTNLAGLSSSFFNLNRYWGSSGSTALPDTTAMPSADFTRMMLAQSRSAHPSEILDLPAGVTDARLYRISVELGTIGIHLEK